MTVVGDMSERDLVHLIRERLAAVPGDGGLDVGPGDDAAVVRTAQHRQVFSVDRQRQGVHFEPGWMTSAEIGARAVAVAASDIWAMGAQPRWLLAALEVHEQMLAADFEALVDGLAAGAAAAGARIVGGDVGRGESLAIVTTAIGELSAGHEPLRRIGARPGDELWIVGALGMAAAGRALLAGGDLPSSGPAADCLDAFRCPATPTDWCLWAGGADEVHAMMDVSDGLAVDLHRLCAESGVGALLDAAAVQHWVPPTVAARVGVSALDLALGGGDDYAMLCAIAAEPRGELAANLGATMAHRIGAVTDSGHVVMRDGTACAAVPACGWDPFKGASSD
jgi:thiamine-monophosphate kinase